ncbi:hypothetical protein [Ekhidna sp.]
MNHFKWIATQNCIRFYKRTYTLNHDISQALIDALSDLGMLEQFNFSEYSPSSKDLFKIKLDLELEISGTLSDTYLQVTVSRNNPEILALIEKKINQWSTLLA